MTPTERVLWQFLRRKKLLGYQFRRQHPVGDYITDFCCLEAALIIEVDGDVHRDPTQRARDHRRDEILHEAGFLTLRFSNDQVRLRTLDVVEYIERVVSRRGAGSR